MSITSKVLSNLISIWEDAAAVSSAMVRLTGKGQSVFERARNFREALLHCGTGATDNAESCLIQLPDLEKLPNKTDAEKFLKEAATNLSLHPAMMLDWTVSSRRVFRLNTDMQNAFENIDVSDISMSDIQWPFDSFVLELAYPIEVEGMQISHLFIGNGMKYRDDMPDNEAVLSSRFVYNIPVELSDYKPFPLSEVAKLQKAIKNQNQSRMIKFLKTTCVKWIRRYPKHFTSQYIISTNSPLSIKLHADITLGMKILVNLCLYLEAMQVQNKSSETNMKWRSEVNHTPGTVKVITDKLNICDISNYHTLQSISDNSHTGTGKSGGQVSPHWRRGYRRRAAGEGNNPNAPKSVKVPPTLVRADLIPEIGLPRSSMSCVR